MGTSFKFLVLDVDGVLTDGGMYYTEQGDEFKKFNAKDGLAIRALTRSGFPVGIISHGFLVNLVKRRAELLGISRVYVGSERKLKVLQDWCGEMGIAPREVAYIGDDVNDLEMLRAVGVTACPSDAVMAVKEAVHLELQLRGGEGCVREFIDRYFPDLLPR